MTFDPLADPPLDDNGLSFRDIEAYTVGSDEWVFLESGGATIVMDTAEALAFAKWVMRQFADG